VRDNETGGKRTVSLPTDTFIGRFLRHVLPAGFKRLRHYGLLACGHKRARLAAARAALQTPAPQAVVIEAAEDFLARVSGEDPRCCPHCGSGVGTRSRSSWLAGTIRPRRRRAVGMGRHEHSRAPISILADAAFAPAGRGTFPDWRTRPTPPARRRVGTRLRPITAMAASAEPGAATR
jgi:hypothetical protein